MYGSAVVDAVLPLVPPLRHQVHLPVPCRRGASQRPRHCGSMDCTPFQCSAAFDAVLHLVPPGTKYTFRCRAGVEPRNGHGGTTWAEHSVESAYVTSGGQWAAHDGMFSNMGTWPHGHHLGGALGRERLRDIRWAARVGLCGLGLGHRHDRLAPPAYIALYTLPSYSESCYLHKCVDCWPIPAYCPICVFMHLSGNTPRTAGSAPGPSGSASQPQQGEAGKSKKSKGKKSGADSGAPAAPAPAPAVDKQAQKVGGFSADGTDELFPC